MRGGVRESVARLDLFQRRHGWIAFPVAVVRKAGDDQGGSLVALMAYYGFLSVFPLLLAFASILGFALGGDPAAKATVLGTVDRSFPTLSGFIGKTVSGNGTALGLGVAGALWAGLGVTRAVERVMNAAWNVPLTERPNYVKSRLRGLAMLGILGTTFLVATGLASLGRAHGALAVPAAALTVVGPLVLDWMLFALAFLVLTNRRLSLRSIAPGAVVGAIAWTVLQRVGAYYVRHAVAHASRLYGSLAAVIGLLAWISLGAVVTLLAAEVNAVIAQRLWPRSLFVSARATGRREVAPPTDADVRVLALLVNQVRADRPRDLIDDLSKASPEDAPVRSPTSQSGCPLESSPADAPEAARTSSGESPPGSARECPRDPLGDQGGEGRPG